MDIHPFNGVNVRWRRSNYDGRSAGLKRVRRRLAGQLEVVSNEA
jgi:hypothetical protein